MRSIRVGIGLVLFWFTMSQAAYAQDPAIVDIFKNGFYGGLAGALVGAAALAFTDEPEDHLDYIAIGAGVGVIAGTAYGIYTATYVLTFNLEEKPEDRRWALNFPEPQIALKEGELGSRRHSVEYRLPLLKIQF